LYDIRDIKYNYEPEINSRPHIIQDFNSAAGKSINDPSEFIFEVETIDSNKVKNINVVVHKKLITHHVHYEDSRTMMSVGFIIVFDPAK